MSILDTIKQRIKAALAAFARRKAEDQAEGMTQEAQGIVAGAKDLARRNPVGFATLVLLFLGVIYLSIRTNSKTSVEG